MSESFTTPLEIVFPDEVDPWVVSQIVWDAVDEAIGGGSTSNDIDATTFDRKAWRRPSLSQLQKVVVDAYEVPQQITWLMRPAGWRTKGVHGAIVMMGFYKKTFVRSNCAIRIDGTSRIDTELAAQVVKNILSKSKAMRLRAPGTVIEVEPTEIHSLDTGEELDSLGEASSPLELPANGSDTSASESWWTRTRREHAAQLIIAIIAAIVAGLVLLAIAIYLATALNLHA